MSNYKRGDLVLLTTRNGAYKNRLCRFVSWYPLESDPDEHSNLHSAMVKIPTRDDKGNVSEIMMNVSRDEIFPVNTTGYSVKLLSKVKKRK